MRRRAFNQEGNILRWVATNSVHKKSPLTLQEAGSDLIANAESRQHLVQDGAVEETAKHEAFFENGKKVPDTRRSLPRRPLPLSPLMDPVYQAAKQKYTLPKLPPCKEPTFFQGQLAKNPYALALATPVRMCAQTRIQLPSFFLQDFEVIPHPTTNEPWYLPRSLTSKHSSFATTDQDLTVDAPDPKHSSPITDPDLSSSKPLPENNKGIKRGYRVYALSRKFLFRAMGENGTGFKSAKHQFSWSQTKLEATFLRRNARWRRDTDVLVLDLMRRRIVEQLKWLCERDVGYLQGCADWEAAKSVKLVGAILWLGRGDGNWVAASREAGRDAGGSQGEETTVGQMGKQVVVHEEEEGLAASQVVETDTNTEGSMQDSSPDTAPGQFATLDIDRQMRRKTPVHNLRVLLGDSLVEDLRKQIPGIFGHEVVTLKRKRVTLDIQLRLWKLQGYLAEYEQIDGE